MLQLMRRGRRDALRPLEIEEDRALRRAFGRFALRAARPEGARVVRSHQGALGGQWIACDCLGSACPPPVLVPVAETHVRRHVEPPWPEHAEWCDFYREAEAQRAISASFRRPSLNGHLGLVRGFGSAEPLERALTRASAERGRGRLATLLFTLLESAGLARVSPGQVPSLSQQCATIRKAAAAVELDTALPLSRFLCTYPPALPELMEKIGRATPRQFRHSQRPHGLLIGVAAEASRGRIVPTHGDPFEVAGAISIFGELDGHAAGRIIAGERAPYVMGCLVGGRHPDEPVTVLRGYLHPCASPSWLLPVDSNHERGTLKQLLSLRRWLVAKRAVEVLIEKPIFDLAPPPLPPSPGEEQDPHEPVIPDFILCDPQGRAVVVETMGYDMPAYRDRKARMHGEMSRLCGDGPVVLHDFCLPPNWSQEDRDRQFWRECRKAIIGPDTE